MVILNSALGVVQMRDPLHENDLRFTYQISMRALMTAKLQ